MPEPLKPALKPADEERPASVKAVQIHEPEPEPEPEDPPPKRPHPIPRRHQHYLPDAKLSALSNNSTTSLSSSLRPSGADAGLSGDDRSASDALGISTGQQSPHLGGHRGQRYYTQKLVAQVAEWLEREKKKLEQRKGRRHVVVHRRRKSKSPPVDDNNADQYEGKNRAPDGDENRGDASIAPRPRSNSFGSSSINSNSSEVSLDRLQRIIEGNMSALGLGPVSELSLAKPRAPRKKLLPSLQRTVSSDTEYHDGDVVVPGCDALLDNTRTLTYGDATTSREQKKAHKAWAEFKNEIIRLAHTLRLKGWRKVPLDAGDSVTVERLSGALTNAVYVVSPPADVPSEPGRRPPQKLLLRIYGPNVDTLIDREHELGVLQRLARKKIGPRLLGTFTNGRFEQYLNSTTLTPADIRRPETSRAIAKRMRELHDGISLLPEERAAGPVLWINWDKWLDSVEAKVRRLDQRVVDGTDGGMVGYVCGVEWAVFKRAVDKYRAYVDEVYGSAEAVRDRLVFAHNDTQYGNILRVRPDDETSPLLQPENQHRQLVVIDFEYAAPNTIGYEFANHFTEWTYNYHDPVAPHRCNAHAYPTVDEQRRFARAYVEHRSRNASAPGTPPLRTPISPRTSISPDAPAAPPNTIVDFMLDARVPVGGWKEAERARQEAVDRRVEELLGEARLWRPGCSLKWIAWGIVQALDEKEEKKEDGGGSDEDEEEGKNEFDYLAYARERAMFFWGDCVRLGIVGGDDVVGIKRVDY